MNFIRMQRSDLGIGPKLCVLAKPCVYRVDGVCDQPATNKGNDDAACHRMSNKAIAPLLVVLQEKQGD